MENVETQEGHYDDSDDLNACHTLFIITAAKIQKRRKTVFILGINRFILGKKRFILDKNRFTLGKKRFILGKFTENKRKLKY